MPGHRRDPRPDPGDDRHDDLRRAGPQEARRSRSLPDRPPDPGVHPGVHHRDDLADQAAQRLGQRARARAGRRAAGGAALGPVLRRAGLAGRPLRQRGHPRHRDRPPRAALGRLRAAHRRRDHDPPGADGLRRRHRPGERGHRAVRLHRLLQVPRHQGHLRQRRRLGPRQAGRRGPPLRARAHPGPRGDGRRDRRARVAAARPAALAAARRGLPDGDRLRRVRRDGRRGHPRGRRRGDRRRHRRRARPLRLPGCGSDPTAPGSSPACSVPTRSPTPPACRCPRTRTTTPWPACWSASSAASRRAATRCSCRCPSVHPRGRRRGARAGARAAPGRADGRPAGRPDLDQAAAARSRDPTDRPRPGRGQADEHPGSPLARARPAARQRVLRRRGVRAGLGPAYQGRAEGRRGLPGRAHDAAGDGGALPDDRRRPVRDHGVLAGPRRRRRAGAGPPDRARRPRGAPARRLAAPGGVHDRDGRAWSTCTSCSARWCPRTSRWPDPSVPRWSSVPPMVAIVTLLKPIVYGLDAMANAVVRLLRVEPRNEVTSTFTLEEVEAMVDESHDEGMLDESEYERLAGALGFTSRTVADVLLPLDQLETVRPRRRATEVEAGLRRRRATPASPSWGTTGALVGYLHIKDVLQADPHGRARVVEDKWIRPFADVRALRHPGQRPADAPGQGRAHGPRRRRRRRGGRGGHPRGRHRGAGRRDPRRGPRRRPLRPSRPTGPSRARHARGTRPGTSAVVGGPPGRASSRREPPRLPRRDQRYLKRPFIHS